MTAEQVVGYLLKDDGADLLRESLRCLVQGLMEAEVSALIGARHSERTADRAAYRNGYRSRRWETRAGEIELAIPKLRRGSYFPTFLRAGRRSEAALVALVQRAYVTGVSLSQVRQVVESLGLRMSQAEVARVWRGLHEQVEAFKQRPLEGRYPYLWFDVNVEQVRGPGRMAPRCLVIARGVHETGRRELIDIGAGECEAAAFWRDFLNRLVHRGLTGVELAISDPHPGLKTAIAGVLGASWQRSPPGPAARIRSNRLWSGL